MAQPLPPAPEGDRPGPATMRSWPATLLLLLALSALLWHCGNTQAAEPADSRPGPPPEGRNGTPPSPPPEAIAACRGQAEGARVRFTDRNGRSVEGECRKMPGATSSDTLAARPLGRPPGDRPPPGPGEPPPR